MSFTFDGVNKLITCNPGVTSFTAEGVYSRWKDWLAESATNAGYLPAFENSIGGNPLGNGVSLGGYIFITNGWKIKPQEANHRLDITGNLFAVPDTADIFQATTGSYNVVISLNTSSLTQQVLSGGGSGATASEIADAVWDADLSTAQTNDSAGDVLKKANRNALISAALST